jgi:hypothetical protein
MDVLLVILIGLAVSRFPGCANVGVKIIEALMRGSIEWKYYLQ